MQTQCGFIGGGNMARALIGGLLAAGRPSHQLHVADPDPQTLAALERDYAVLTYADNAQAVRDAQIWVLAVKPQVMGDVCRGLRVACDQQRPLIVSIAAGITLGSLQGWFGPQAKLIRAMPNTPALVGAGVTALCANANASQADSASAEAIFAGVGPTVAIDDESLMDAVTAVSGSGPAYFFALIEALEAAAVAQGLSADAAAVLVRQTALGAATMARSADVPPGELRRRVTSPGGTTAAGIAALQDGHFATIVGRAVAAATTRGAELAQEFGNQA